MNPRQAIRDTLEATVLPFWRQRRMRRNEMILLAKANGATIREIAKVAKCNARTVKRVCAQERLRVAALKAAQPAEAPAQTPAQVEQAAEQDLLMRAEAIYKAAHRPAPEPPQEVAPPAAPKQLLSDGVMLRFDPDMSYDQLMRIHPLDRALMGFSFGDYERVHPHDDRTYRGGFSLMFQGTKPWGQ